MAYVDFAALKERVPIIDAFGWLGLELRQRGEQLRGPCPTCQSGGDRALVVTPAKQAFYCFGGRTGGDVIALVAHIRGTDMKEAAGYLQSQIGGLPVSGNSSPEGEGQGQRTSGRSRPEALDLSRAGS